MSQENVETVRAVYEEWGAGNFGAGVELYDPFAVLVLGAGFPEPGAHVGLEGIKEYMRGFLEAWESVTIEAGEVVDAVDCVLVAVVQRGAGKGSGAAGELRYFHVWSFRRDKVIRLDMIRDRSEALEAAGLRE